VLLRENSMGIWDAPDGIPLRDAPFVAGREPFEDFSQPIGIPGFAVDAEKKEKFSPAYRRVVNSNALGCERSAW